jgi:hypothetical protein
MRSLLNVARKFKAWMLKHITPISLIFSFSFPLIIYCLTLAPTVFHYDSAELTTACATLGLTRSTGYPLYVLLGYFWTHIPVGDVGFRMNLFSAVCGALTILLGDRFLSQLGVTVWSRLAALGSLAFSLYFWSLSLIAEVYTLHTALTMVTLLCLLSWRADPKPLRLGLVGLLIGLSLGNHLSTLLLIPAYALFVSLSLRKMKIFSTLFIGLAGLILGASIYLYLPLRYAAQPAFNYAGFYDSQGIFHPDNLQSWGGFWGLVTGTRFSDRMFAYNLTELWRQSLQFGNLLIKAFFGLGIGPGILGLVSLFRRDSGMAWLTLGMFTGHALFYISYGVLDKELMFLPNFMIWSIWMAFGYDWLLHFIDPPNQTQASSIAYWGKRATVLCIVGMAGLALIWNWKLVDRSNDWSARQKGEKLLTQVLPSGWVLGHWNTAPILEYFQKVEGRRTDIRIINRFLISPAALQELIQKQATKRPLYIDYAHSNLPAGLEAQNVGLLFYIHPKK